MARWLMAELAVVPTCIACMVSDGSQLFVQCKPRGLLKCSSTTRCRPLLSKRPASVASGAGGAGVSHHTLPDTVPSPGILTHARTHKGRKRMSGDWGLRRMSGSGSLYAGQGTRAGCLEWAPHVAGVHVQDADVGRRAHGRGRRRWRGRLRGRRGRRRVERRGRRAVRAGRLRRGRHERRRLRHLRGRASSIGLAALLPALGAQPSSTDHGFRHSLLSLSKRSGELRSDA